MNKMPLGAKILLIVCIVGFVAVGFVFYGAYLSHRSNMSKLDADYNSVLQMKDRQTSVEVSVTPVPEEIIRDIVAEAQAAGDDAVQCQKDCMDCLGSAVDFTNPDDPLAQKLTAASNKLRALFGDDAGYYHVWYTWDAETVTAEWECLACREYENLSVPVIWLCRDSDGKLLAYVAAQYDSARGVFYDCSKGVTYEGARASAYDMTDPDDFETDDPNTPGSNPEVDEVLANIYKILQRMGYGAPSSEEGGNP